MWNWWKLRQKADLNFLKIDYNKPTKEDLNKLFEKFENEYLETFGSGKESEQLLDLLKRKIVNQADFLLGKKWVINHLKVIDFQIEQLEKSTKGQKAQSLEEISSILSKFMGFRVDPKVESVVEFKAKLNLLEEENKRIEKHGTKTNTKH
jgi:hypothetical protein